MFVMRIQFVKLIDRNLRHELRVLMCWVEMLMQFVISRYSRLGECCKLLISFMLVQDSRLSNWAFGIGGICVIAVQKDMLIEVKLGHSARTSMF